MKIFEIFLKFFQNFRVVSPNSGQYFSQLFLQDFKIISSNFRRGFSKILLTVAVFLKFFQNFLLVIA